jgi:hypothetical protein
MLTAARSHGKPHAADWRHEGLGSVVLDMMAPRQKEACA